jgi:DNA-directed RNA polymerase specialized sigma24 family protein
MDRVALVTKVPGLMSTKAYKADALWKWRDSLREELQPRLMTAYEEVLPFARYSAWSFLHDGALANELLEEAMESVHAYALKTSPPPATSKLAARLRSQVRRVAKQRANRQSKEDCVGSLLDMERDHLMAETNDLTEMVLIKEIVGRLSPEARKIATWIWMGYSWREIGKTLDIDQNSIRLAFRREADRVLSELGIESKSTQ